MQLLTGLGSWPERMAFSPDGRYLAAGDSRALHLWDLSAGPDPLWSALDGTLARHFTFTSGGAELAYTYYAGFVRYDARTGARSEAPLPAGTAFSMFAPDGRFALAESTDHATKILRLRCARAIGDGWADAWQKELAYEPTFSWDGGYRALLFSPDGGRLVRVFWRAHGRRNISPTGIEVFDSETGQLVASWTGKLPTYASHGATTTSGQVVLLRDRAFYAIDTANPKSEPVKRLNASPKHFTAATFTRDGTRLATTSNDTAATVWDAATWKVHRRYAWEIGRLRTVAFAPDELRCAAGGDTGQIVVWDLDN